MEPDKTQVTRTLTHGDWRWKNPRTYRGEGSGGGGGWKGGVRRRGCVAPPLRDLAPPRRHFASPLRRQLGVAISGTGAWRSNGMPSSSPSRYCLCRAAAPTPPAFCRRRILAARARVVDALTPPPRLSAGMDEFHESGRVASIPGVRDDSNPAEN
jgi:hypothetical protein